MKDKRTTVAGVVAVIGALCTFILYPLLDGNDATGANVGAFLTATASALGLAFAADAGKPPEPPKPAA